MKFDVNVVVAFYHHGPKGGVQDVRNKAQVPLNSVNTAVRERTGEMAEWLTKLSGTILNMMVAFYHHGPKGEVQDVRNKAQVPLNSVNTAARERTGEMAEWLTKLSGTILNMMVAFYHHGPKGGVQDVRNKAQVTLNSVNTADSERTGEMAEWLKAHPC